MHAFYDLILFHCVSGPNSVLACPNGENFQEMVLRISYNNKQLLHELLHIKARDSLANGVSVKTIQVHCGILCVIIDQSRGSL